MPTPTGRLAPSPTGALHVGHGRTFLLAWLAARSLGGRIVLRIEDLDASRLRPEASAQAIHDLQWLGLDWDEGPDLSGNHAPYVQSQRMATYHAALERLKSANLVYPCTCTRADVARAASAPHASDEGPSYPGICAHRTPDDAPALFAAGRSFAWRFRASGPIAWPDRLRGPQSIDPRVHGGDFIIARSTGEIGYQLAVVVDDAAMDITQVVRGDDLVPSTPRQILLDHALGLPVPEFAHVPLVLDAEGRRLAKRDQSLKLATLRERGITSAQLVETLARSLGLAPGSPSPGPSPHHWVRAFDWSLIPPDPWRLDLPASAADA